MIRTASDRALLVECADLADTIARHAALVAADLVGVTELVPGASTILVTFDPVSTSADELSAQIRELAPQEFAESRAGKVTIPVRYQGADLADLAELMSVSPAEIVRRHTAANWRVAFCGFAPGFGYLVCDDPFFDAPRHSSPRTRLPAGSVALAGNFTGVYPRESPGGWQLIGHTDEVMWDLNRQPPALFSPGTAVRFVVAGPDQAVLNGGSRDSVATLVDPDRKLTVIHSGLPLLVQDLGRGGFAALGVSGSGAADRAAARAANRIVGNAEGAAVLEIAFGGVEVEFSCDTVATITGAELQITRTEQSGGSEDIPHGRPFGISAGSRVALGPVRRGARAVLAVRGGVRAATALGSSATDTLGGLGPKPLSVGDAVWLGDPDGAPGPVRPEGKGPLLPRPGDLVTLDITLGPRDDWFTNTAIAALTEQPWLVTPRSDRVGLRLRGDYPLHRDETMGWPAELPSEGAVTGAIQVPPDGQPVLFLPDHPLTGGYPVIGAVTARHLDLLGQLPPGVLVSFRVA